MSVKLKRAQKVYTKGHWILLYHPLLVESWGTSRAWRVRPLTEVQCQREHYTGYDDVHDWLQGQSINSTNYSTRAQALDALSMALDSSPPPWII